MERQSFENFNEREIVPLENARFLDRLEPIYEQQWEELLEAAAATNMNLTEFAIPLWQDESMFSAIRDRALMLLVSKHAIGEWKGSWNRQIMELFGGGFHLDHVKGHEEMFKKWLDEALSYGDIIDDKILFRLSYELFENWQWDQERLEQTLESFDPQAVSPASHDDYPLDRDRFPYLDDIIKGVTASKSSIRLRMWANDKFTEYLEDPTSRPEIKEESAKSLLKSIYYGLDKGQYIPKPLKAGIKKYGFDIIEAPYEGQRLMNHLDTMPQSLIIEYAKWRFTNCLVGRGALYETSREQIMSHIKDPVPEDLRLLYAEVVTHQEKQAEIKRQKDASWRRQREVEKLNDPAEIAKRQANKQYMEILGGFVSADKVAELAIREGVRLEAERIKEEQTRKEEAASKKLFQKAWCEYFRIPYKDDEEATP